MYTFNRVADKLVSVHSYYYVTEAYSKVCTITKYATHKRGNDFVVYPLHCSVYPIVNIGIVYVTSMP